MTATVDKTDSMSLICVTENLHLHTQRPSREKLSRICKWKKLRLWAFIRQGEKFTRSSEVGLVSLRGKSIFHFWKFTNKSLYVWVIVHALGSIYSENDLHWCTSDVSSFFHLCRWSSFISRADENYITYSHNQSMRYDNLLWLRMNVYVIQVVCNSEPYAHFIPNISNVNCTDYIDIVN